MVLKAVGGETEKKRIPLCEKRARKERLQNEFMSVQKKSRGILCVRQKTRFSCKTKTWLGSTKKENTDKKYNGSPSRVREEKMKRKTNAVCL